MMIILRPTKFRVGDTELYDVFPVSEDTLVGIGPFTGEYTKTITVLDRRSGMRSKPGVAVKDSHQHTLILLFKFDGRAFGPANQRCGLLFSDGQHDAAVEFDCVPVEPARASMSTLTIESSDLVLKWVDYHHRTLGIDRFHIYSNSVEHFSAFTEAASASPLRDMITAVLWDVPYRYPGASISGQTTQQNHSIYRFGRDGLIGLFDVDEYIVPNAGNLVDVMMDTANDFLLMQEYKFSRVPVGAISLQCLMFGCGRGAGGSRMSFLEDMRWSATEPEPKWIRQKCFVLPPKIKVFSVHMVVDGSVTYCLPPSIARFYHYHFLGKPQGKCDCDKYCATENTDIARFG